MKLFAQAVLALSLCMIAAIQAHADDFGQIGTLNDFRPGSVWLSATGDSYISKILRSGDATLEVHYRFRLTEPEIDNLTAFLAEHDIWHTDCRPKLGSYDGGFILIWQKQGAVLRKACQNGLATQSGSNFVALLKLLRLAAGDAGSCVEIYRGSQEFGWVPPGYPAISPHDIATIAR